MLIQDRAPTDWITEDRPREAIEVVLEACEAGPAHLSDCVHGIISQVLRV